MFVTASLNGEMLGSALMWLFLSLLVYNFKQLVGLYPYFFFQLQMSFEHARTPIPGGIEYLFLGSLACLQVAQNTLTTGGSLLVVVGFVMGSLAWLGGPTRSKGNSG
ncbi:hypothetical protein [Candidatus Cyanaurora vandensis]|uniref:hypothetical protein n=1 Tax=Candidatus Cyanaurora vandensis TaxID=2714958 RepID=UPI00257FEB5E|nr:hypothetical protein [Candidatus Cyanaurora vandensis]